MVDISMSTDKYGNTMGGSSTSVLLPPLSTQTFETITKSMKAFSIPKGDRFKNRCIDKQQMLSEYYGCDSPPAGKYNTETKETIKGGAIVSEQRFKEPKSIKLLKANIPIGYLNNFDTFKQSTNASQSNLSKADRFNHRKVYERDLQALPGPLSYNLSTYNSISYNTSLDRETQAKLKFSPKKVKYDRFKNKVYFKELDRTSGGNR